MSESWQRFSGQTRAERQLYISAMTRCWAECASILVVDHHLRVSARRSWCRSGRRLICLSRQDWDTYLAYGQESWERLGDEIGKRQVGMNFMLNVAQLDPPVMTVRFNREHARQALLTKVWFAGIRRHLHTFDVAGFSRATDHH